MVKMQTDTTHLIYRGETLVQAGDSDLLPLARQPAQREKHLQRRWGLGRKISQEVPTLPTKSFRRSREDSFTSQEETPNKCGSTYSSTAREKKQPTNRRDRQSARRDHALKLEVGKR